MVTTPSVEPSPEPTHLLLVDDSPADLSALQVVLEPLGQRLILARSGQEALRCVLAADFAAILMDVRLGDMTGVEVTALLRERERTRNTPILLLTAAVDDERMLLKGYEYGVVDYLRKPLTPEVLRAKVRVFVELHRAREAVRLREEALRERERQALEHSHREQLHLMLLQAPAAICITRGPDFIFEFVNPVYEQVVGRPVPLGKSLREVLPEFATQPELMKILRGVLATGQPFIGSEFPLKWDRHGTGELEPGFFNLIYQPVRDGRGNISGVLTFAVEVTAQVQARNRAEALAAELKESEQRIRQLNAELEARVQERTTQLEEANRELEAFSYSVSHDLRTPLRHINGFAQMLDRKVGATLDEASRGHLRTIISAAQQGSTLIDDLLAFSRASRTEPRRMRVELRELVESVRRELETDVAGRDIEWHVGALPSVEADPALLRQVVRNLLGNAVKYTRPRARAVVEVGSRLGEGEVEVWVRDNGVGFDLRYADRLFGVFQRLHTADQFEGTGIGLANVRRIISRHGGRTWAEGAVEQGATFHFTLPLASPGR